MSNTEEIIRNEAKQQFDNLSDKIGQEAKRYFRLGFNRGGNWAVKEFQSPADKYIKALEGLKRPIIPLVKNQPVPKPAMERLTTHNKAIDEAIKTIRELS